VSELFREVAVKVADRPGGYTRILKTGNRIGDNAEMCFIELVDYNTTYVKESAKPVAKKTRRGAKPKKTEVETQESKPTEPKEEIQQEPTDEKSE